MSPGDASYEVSFQSRRAAEIQQPDRGTATNKSGSVAALEPVESVQPITLAGGSLSLAGTRTVHRLALANAADPRNFVTDSAVPPRTIVTFSTDLGLLDGTQATAASTSSN